MFRQGHDLSSDLFISQRLKGLVTGYTLPDSTDIRSSTKLQLNLQKENTTTYTSKIFALELDRNRSFDGGRQGTVYIRAQDEDYSVGTERSTARLLLPGLRFTDNHYDNPVRPHKGFHYAFDLHGTDQMLGSDTALLQLVGQGDYLLPLPWRLSLNTRAKAGMTITNDSIDDIPPSLRFFAGGAQSVRGYSYQSLGPRNNSGKVEGGKQLLTAGIELERSLFSDWGVSIFYDAGNAFDSFTNISLFQGAGIGLHYYTTFGAVNLSVAKPLGSGRSALHYYVTVGFGI
jgi:translocation and assembly module TamA